ncbi:SDR family NAD(P)-dependent oxidoreductase [Spirochaeta dissipatitropha]
MTNVKDRWALVTGASRGVGYLTALFMAAKGCKLVLHSRDALHTEAVLREVRDLGVEAFSVSAELSDPASVQQMLEKIKTEIGHVDIIFNNAAVQIAYRTDWASTPVTDFTDSFMINTIAPAMICYSFLPEMMKRGFGRIVNTTSGIQNQPQQAGYSASKAALDKLTTDLASMVQGSDVMINLTDPGWCRTDLGGELAPNSVESALPGVVLGAFLEDGISGRLLPAQNFSDMDLESAVQKVRDAKGDINE